MVAMTGVISPISIDWYFYELKGNEIIMCIRPIWPFDAKRADLQEKELISFVEKSIGLVEIKNGFLKIEATSLNRVLVKFDIYNWMKENFLSSPKVEFYLPATLEWQWKKNLPATVLSKVPWNVTRMFLENKFKEFLKKHSKKVFEQKLKLMKKINFDWFTYEADMQFSKFFVRIKPSILLTLALVGGTLVKAVTGTSEIGSWRR